MSIKYRGSLGFLLLVSLIALSLGRPLFEARASLSPDAVVAIDPAELTVDLQDEFTVAVSIEDVSDLFSYQFTVAFDPTVVEVLEVTKGPFLESTGQSSVKLGPDIDNQAGTVVFGMLGMGDGPWPSEAGELATITFKAVGEGVTDLDLQDVAVFNADLDAIAAVAEDGQVRVGDAVPTATRTPTGVATSPPGATATKTPTEAATSPPGATATKTPTEAATSPPGATATRTPTEAVTSPPGATATEPPTEGGTPVATSGATSTAQPGQTPVVGGSPSATAEPVEGGDEDVEPAATSTDEPTGGETPSGVSPGLIVVAVLLGVAGLALIGVGVFVFGLRRRPGGEPMDDAKE